LVYLLAERLLGDRTTALLAGCLFAAAASGSEAVFWSAAYGHRLAAALYLTTLLLFLSRLEGGSPATGRCAFAAFIAGLLTKASFYSSWAALALVPSSSRGERARVLGSFTVVFIVALALNVGVALSESYLVRRGIYVPGWHMATNLGELLARIVFPFRAVFDRVGLATIYLWLLNALRLVVPCVAAVIVVVGDRRARFSVILAVLALAPFLPFVYDPTSRYTYLATAGWSWLAALIFISGVRRFRQRVLTAAVVALFVAAHLSEIVLEDNEYEYRERQISRLIADVQGIYVREPANRTITVLDLPKFAIDRGIHLQAALALAYEDDALVLIAPEPGTAVEGEALEYVDGRIRRRKLQDTRDKRY